MFNRLMAFALVIVLFMGLTACDKETRDREQREAEVKREKYWYLCVNKKDENDNIVEMTEFDKFKIMRKHYPNHRVLAVDGMSGREGSYSPGSTFIIISRDTLIQDMNNQIIGTQIHILSDDGDCECCTSYSSRKFQYFTAFDYSE